MFSYKSVRTSISFKYVKLIFHTKHFSSPFLAEGQEDRNLRDDPLLILKFLSGNGCQASWQASVRISEGAAELQTYHHSEIADIDTRKSESHKHATQHGIRI